MAVKDKRFVFTETLLRNTYLDMLKELPPDKITVAEVCRRAGINRGTFYLHYKDCWELMEALGKELADRLGRSLEGIFDSDASLRVKVSELLSALYADGGTGYMLFANDRSHCFEHLAESARELAVGSWMARSTLTRQQAELVYAYIAGGCYSLACQIGGGELRADDPDVYEFLLRLISGGLGAFVTGIA